MCWIREGMSLSEMAARLGRSKSTVSREVARNSCVRFYRASTAQRRYEERRASCVRGAKLDDAETCSVVAEKLLGENWSPEQIEIRLRLEGSPCLVSGSTIRRGIRSGRFDRLLPGQCKASRRLRHKGKRRRSKGHPDERRGKFPVPARIDERPIEATERLEIGHWESDTVAGVGSGACIVTNVDRKSGFAVGAKAARKTKAEVSAAMVSALKGHPAKTCTPDCGKEFAGYADVAEELGVEFYFAYPRHPWERGSNENFNGLLREYFPKGMPLEDVPDCQIQEAFDRLNLRPRKRHGGRTPYEVYYSTELHLV